MRTLLSLLLFFALLAGAAAAYHIFWASNISHKRVAIKIPTGSAYADVLAILKQNKVLEDEFSFEIVSKLKKYPEHINSGYYVFRRGMNNRQIVNMLLFGWQTPVKLVMYNLRTKEDFAGLVSHTLEIDSLDLLRQLNSETFCKSHGSDTNNILTHFMVDNYEFYWNVSLKAFLAKMETAYNSFWNEERRAKADALNKTPAQITTLASIVEREVIFDKEMPTVAGVYLNRLRIGMPLQADPTLVFAMRDFSARRITNYHKDFDSPYNTYLYPGLPPGPICMPKKKSIDAVLNAEVHPYLYFCANPDMSGYSIFSKSYQEQMKVAAQYQKKLNKMNIH